MTAPIEQALFSLLEAREPGKSVSAEEVARAADPERWRRILPQVRATAVGLARQALISASSVARSLSGGMRPM